MLAFYSRQLLICTRKKGKDPFLSARTGGNQDHRRLQPMAGSVDNAAKEEISFMKEPYCWIYALPLIWTDHPGARALCD